MTSLNSNTLHHYTSVSGFDGIINSHSLRMTESHFLNDPSDCRLFISFIKEYLTDKTIAGIIKNTSNKYKLPSERKEQITALCQKGQYDFISYINYIHEHISLYVTSFTTDENHDVMTMWNYYGNGGIELTFDKDQLLDLFKTNLNFDNDYLTMLPAAYVPVNGKLEDVKIPNFSDFLLINKKSDNIFESHKKTITESMSSDKEPDLYDTEKLTTFIETYFKSYILTLAYLLENKEIKIDTPANDVFYKVFTNVSSLDKKLLWKHDLSLYMLVLSALIKPKTYEYEKEHRIVYFKYSLKYRKKEEYVKKQLPSGEFLCPYINLSENNKDSKAAFFKALKEITLSPSTHNIPIDAEKYRIILQNYLFSRESDSTNNNKNNTNTDIPNDNTTEIKVKKSQHTIRW